MQSTISRHRHSPGHVRRRLWRYRRFGRVVEAAGRVAGGTVLTAVIDGGVTGPSEVVDTGGT